MKISQWLNLSFVLILVSCQTSSTGNTPETTPTEIKKIKWSRPKESLSREARLNIPYRTLDTSKVISAFGFGSCNDQNRPQPLWKLIQAKSPQVFIMMGDNVYASKDRPMIDQYIKLNSNEDYLNLREAVPFMATWDDHDYGQSDGGFDNPDKVEAKRLFTKYWSYTKNLLVDQEAVYHSRIVGEKNRRVQFIILDTRSDRSPLLPNIPMPLTTSADTTPSPVDVVQPIKMFLPNEDPKAHILSDAQWKWLESEMKKPAELRILVSSIQVLANDPGFEKWGNFPIERTKLLNLIEKLKLKNLVILSGDRHLASIAKLKTKNYELFDITASSLNKISKATEPEVDALYTEPGFLGINFGYAEIDWSRRQVEFQVVGEDSKAHLSQTVKF